jgi:hypothetical protein
VEENGFWGCELYKDQRATVMDILSEKSKKECPGSVKELLRLKEKICARHVTSLKTFLNVFKN